MSAAGRPQRRLTDADLKAIRGVQTLYLHRMLHLGLLDPVANDSPMSEDEGAWVREHAWPAFLHHIDDSYAFGFWRWAMCERGTCWNCHAGRCDLCLHRQKGRPDACDNTDAVHNHQGRRVADLILRPGGERCVWWCRCPCPKTGEAPARRPARARKPRTGRPQPERPRPTGPRRSDEPGHRGQPTLPGL
ncbi:DUF6248 family natural product biosynthesis protein [Streptomyces sp. NPDC021100]|uniref:DUF6248 family natural product biosynthesis protein n=1 Tax=Streptomyces sp. NPDC021100 TaxID=3365114 RepID=UPI0037B8EABE